MPAGRKEHGHMIDSQISRERKQNFELVWEDEVTHSLCFTISFNSLLRCRAKKYVANLQIKNTKLREKNDKWCPTCFILQMLWNLFYSFTRQNVWQMFADFVWTYQRFCQTLSIFDSYSILAHAPYVKKKKKKD